MAEFQEVMHHMGRICAKYWPVHEEECNKDCPLYRTWCLNVDDDVPRRHRERRDMAKVEEAVMAWAAEHPEPVYPTWEEWLQSVGVMERSEGLLTRLQGQLLIDGIPAHAVPTSKVLQPMDADIAQKLGIEPKEG